MPLLPGDWIGSIGKATWRDPWDWPLYKAMREYAEGRYPWPGAETRITHVRVVIPNGEFFEQTTPKSRILPIGDPGSDLAGKFAQGLIRVARWPDTNTPDLAELAHHAYLMKGMKYDYGDLLDFGLTGLTGLWRWLVALGPVRIFGDKTGRYSVCSTAAATLLERAGVKFPISVRGVDPNWPWNAYNDPKNKCPLDLAPYDITGALTPEDFR